MKKVLVVCVHPDDETLAFGGTLLKHVNNGDEIYWCIVTKITEDLGWSKKRISNREKQIMIVSDLYPFNQVFRLNFLSTQLGPVQMSELITSINNVVGIVKPNIVYLPYAYDIHTDHQIVFKAAISCTKNFRHPYINKILMGETLSETEFSYHHGTTFSPNVYVDISEFIDKKIEIFKVYEEEIMAEEYPRSISNIENLSSYRGSSIGCKHAEAFMLIKEIL